MISMKKKGTIIRLGWGIVGLLQGLKRPLPRKLRKKSEKGLPGPLPPEVKNARKRVEKEPQTRRNLRTSHFRLFL